MKLTKYEHACFTVEKDGELLVVDPGGFTSDFISPDNVTVIVITHAHGDHLDRDLLASIIDKNPDATIVAHPDITSKIEVFQTQAVNAGDSVSIGAFNLEFFGGEHAVIHESMPLPANLGVLINNLVYYPGDSFTVPNKPVDVLALPVAAPWMTVGEAIDFLATVKPRLAFPTHDAILSEIGKGLPDNMITPGAEKLGIEYKRLRDSIEV